MAPLPSHSERSKRKDRERDCLCFVLSPSVTHYLFMSVSLSPLISLSRSLLSVFLFSSSRLSVALSLSLFSLSIIAVSLPLLSLHSPLPPTSLSPRNLSFILAYIMSTPIQILLS